MLILSSSYSKAISRHCYRRSMLLSIPFTIPIRSMRSTLALFAKIARNPHLKSYATDRVHTPIPTTSSNESLNNNPAITFARGKNKSTVAQHPEWVRDFCDVTGCSGKVCLKLCGNYLKSKSKAHFTHSEDDKHKAQKVSDTDLDGNKKPLFAKGYDNPHETSGKSYDPESDKKKTTKLQEYLKNIDENSKKQ